MAKFFISCGLAALLCMTGCDDGNTDDGSSNDSSTDNGGSTDDGSSTSDDTAPPPTAGCTVSAIPSNIRSSYGLDSWYQKYSDANGVLVVSSSVTSDAALLTVCRQIVDMTSKKAGLAAGLANAKLRVAIIAGSEDLSSVPEVNKAYGTSLNWRARGLGWNPTICAEENVLCKKIGTRTDLWKGEGICIHEFGHAISDYGMAKIDSSWYSRLNSAFNADKGAFSNTYADDSAAEFWAEGVQDWYNTNLSSSSPDGVHNYIDTRAEVKTAAPNLYKLLAEVLPENNQFTDCYAN